MAYFLSGLFSLWPIFSVTLSRSRSLLSLCSVSLSLPLSFPPSLCVYRYTGSHSFFDGYCSTVQGLLDWFEVNLGLSELSFIQCVQIYGNSQYLLLANNNRIYLILDATKMSVFAAKRKCPSFKDAVGYSSMVACFIDPGPVYLQSCLRIFTIVNIYIYN